MDTLRCGRCNYSFAGLPETEGRFRCPECGFDQQTEPIQPNLAVGTWKIPVLWAAIPAVAGAALCVVTPNRNDVLVFVVVMGTLMTGGTLGGAAAYRLLREREVGARSAAAAEAWERRLVVRSAVFAFGMLAMDMVILLVIGSAIVFVLE